MLIMSYKGSSTKYWNCTIVIVGENFSVLWKAIKMPELN